MSFPSLYSRRKGKVSNGNISSGVSFFLVGFLVAVFFAVGFFAGVDEGFFALGVVFFPEVFVELFAFAFGVVVVFFFLGGINHHSPMS